MHAAGHLHCEEAAQGRHHPADGEDDEGRDERRLFGLGAEAVPLDDQQREDAGTDHERHDVGRVEEVQRERGDEQHDGDQPRAPLTSEDAARQHDHADAGEGCQRSGRLDDGDGQVLRNEVQVLAQRRRDGGQQVDRAGDEQQDRSETADAADPDVVRRHLGCGRPRRTTRPARRQLGVDLGGFGSALDHGVGGDEPLTHGGERQIGLGQEQPYVKLRPCLDLEGRLLSVMEERGRESRAAPDVRARPRRCAPGQAKKPVSRWVNSGTSAPPTMTPEAPASTAARAASSASTPSSSSCAWAIGRVPDGPPAQGAGRSSPPSARQMPREVMATTRARMARRATAITRVTMKREGQVAS